MRYAPRKLVIPGFVVAVALGAAPSCSNDDVGDDTSVSGENECYDILEMDVCLAETAFLCRWDGSCFPNCGGYTEQSACNDDHSCEWVGTTCTDSSI